MTAKVPLKVHLRLRFQNLGKPRTAGLCGRAAGACDCGPLSCALIERVNKGRKPPKRGMTGRETRIPKGSVLHRRGGIYRVFSHIAHKRRNVRFKGLRRVHTPPQPRTAHTAAHRAKQGRFRWGGVVSLPSACAAWSGTSARAAVRRAYFAIFAWTEGTSERSREPSGRRRAPCASPF